MKVKRWKNRMDGVCVRTWKHLTCERQSSKVSKVRAVWYERRVACKRLGGFVAKWTWSAAVSNLR
jgi:hypothetical protein